METKNVNVRERLWHIQAELNAPKNQYNKFGNYSYRSCEDIFTAVKPLLVKHCCTLTVSDEVVLILYQSHRHAERSGCTDRRAGNNQHRLCKRRRNKERVRFITDNRQLFQLCTQIRAEWIVFDR